ncbi:hypothetical protein TNCV_2309121 [Trichonephila clavipes]|nr:hypothetical protein TNCV_2309121 [Trichonephila clavipes]
MDRNTTATPPLGMLGSLVATLLFALASPSDGTGGLGISAAGGGFNTAPNASEITGLEVSFEGICEGVIYRHFKNMVDNPGNRKSEAWQRSSEHAVASV